MTTTIVCPMFLIQREGIRVWLHFNWSRLTEGSKYCHVQGSSFGLEWGWGSSISYLPQRFQYYCFMMKSTRKSRKPLLCMLRPPTKVMEFIGAGAKRLHDVCGRNFGVGFRKYFGLCKVNINKVASFLPCQDTRVTNNFHKDVFRVGNSYFFNR